MPKILFYDIETTYLLARVWRLGEQVVRHNQLVKGMHYTKIICITYCWNDGKPAKALGWGYNEQNSDKIVREFDKLIKQADVVIGKNSDRFDNKHINTIRMLFNESEAMPEWIKYTDDLEKHIRKYFNLPSNSLDYISSLLGFGGKIKMDFDDWVHIVEKTPGKGKKAYKKMLAYGIKDIEDTRAVWNRIEKHIEPRYKAATQEYGPSCKHCGERHLVLNGTRMLAGTKYQQFRCINGHYAGKISMKQLEKNKGKLG